MSEAARSGGSLRRERVATAQTIEHCRTLVVVLVRLSMSVLIEVNQRAQCLRLQPPLRCTCQLRWHRTRSKYHSQPCKELQRTQHEVLHVHPNAGSA